MDAILTVLDPDPDSLFPLQIRIQESRYNTDPNGSGSETLALECGFVFSKVIQFLSGLSGGGFRRGCHHCDRFWWFRRDWGETFSDETSVVDPNRICSDPYPIFGSHVHSDPDPNRILINSDPDPAGSCWYLQLKICFCNSKNVGMSTCMDLIFFIYRYIIRLCIFMWQFIQLRRTVRWKFTVLNKTIRGSEAGAGLNSNNFKSLSKRLSDH